MNDMRNHVPAATTPSVEQLLHFCDLVKKAKTAMLTTLDSRQEMRSRPLHTIKVDDDGTLWFVVAATSPKAQEADQHEGKVCLSYANISDKEFISITARASLVRDPELKKAVWNKMIDIWFPKGEQDPAVALLKVVPERAEYWDGPSNTVTQLYAFAKAATTGSKDAFGENAKLQF